MKLTLTPYDLRAWRRRLGLTQAAAAEALGLSLAGYRVAEYRCQDRPGAPCQRTVALLAERIEAEGGPQAWERAARAAGWYELSDGRITHPDARLHDQIYAPGQWEFVCKKNGVRR